MTVNDDDRRGRMVGALLRIPFQETVRRVHGALLAEGFSDLRQAHLVVFQHLEGGPLRATDLAERAQITKQSMGYLVEFLAAAGYVAREADSTDGRATLIRLTPRGEAVGRSARKAIARLEGEWADLLGHPRYRAMKEALAELAEAIES